MNRLVEKTCHILDIGARIAVTMIMLVTTLNVIMRLFGSSLKGAAEIVQYLNGLAVGLGLAFCAFHGGHVAVTFFTDKLPPKVQTLVCIVIDLMVAGFLSITAWQLFLYGYGMQKLGEVALTTGLPIYPIVYLVSLGVAMYLLVVINGLVKGLQELFTASPVTKIKSGENTLE